MKVYFHGEVAIYEGSSIPKGAKKLKAKNGHYIVANSETTGNHHVLEAQDGLEVYELDGVLYARSTEECRVSCIMKERHDTQVLPPGIHKFKRKVEYDHLTKSKRVVAD